MKCKRFYMYFLIIALFFFAGFFMQSRAEELPSVTFSEEETFWSRQTESLPITTGSSLKIDIKETKIEPVDSKSRYVRGSTEPLAKIKITYKRGHLVGEGYSKISGLFHIRIPRQEAGVALYVYISDDDGKSWSEPKIIYVQEANYTADEVFYGVVDTWIDQGEPFYPMEGVQAIWRDEDLTAYIKVSGTVDTDKIGKYVLTYTVKNSEGTQFQKSRSIEVRDRKRPFLYVDDITNQSVEVTGSTEAEATVEVRFPNRKYQSVKADKNGYFSIKLPKKLNIGDVFSFQAIDPSKNASDIVYVEVMDSGVRKIIPITDTTNKTRLGRRARFIIGQNMYFLTADGETSIQPMDVSPIIEKGRTLLPARYIAEALDMQTVYSKETKTVALVKGTHIILIKTDEKKMITDKSVYPSNVVIKNNRIFISLKDVTDVLGVKVIWNAPTKSIMIE